MKNNIEKNILDLKHSISLTKAATFFTLGFSSWLAMFFGLKEFYGNTMIILFGSTLIASAFFFYAFKFFKNCENIHEEIKKLN